jgi:pimeloyl-ACP methyl ester carboxylesterase/tellurite resistance protein
MTHFLNDRAAYPDWISGCIEYSIDAMQRSLIYMDVLRRRGNNYIDHLKNGQPPVLTFNYEMILDGRTFTRPVNYALVRISDRRKKALDAAETHERRRQNLRKPAELPKRPIVIIDPRAGHGPGIGGSKRDSEIGMALANDHPVYFILFYTEPMPAQTLSDIEYAQVRFIEEVVKHHPDLDRPAIIGNCQAGWAAALLCADRPDITGPLVLNGAPLSYWSGITRANPMRYRGGLVGGAWISSLLSDLGNGKFDGANLVANFESLNPANTVWSKNYQVYSQVDTEAERYLDFEKWWGGFFMMTDQEIHFIVSNLFVGNKLEKGELELREGEKMSLKNIESPILVFASHGDNITPPQQALNWIPRVYRSVDEIKERGQVIIYMIHEEIGHLGIFVSASIAKKEHREIIGNFDMIDYLPPGLYEMLIEGHLNEGDYAVCFKTRTFEDIAAMSDPAEEEEDFSVAANVSVINDVLYRTFLRPWVQVWNTELSADMMRWLHPLRVQRYMLSDMNPLLRPLKSMASMAREYRRPVSQENPCLTLEKNLSAGVEDALNLYRDTRDHLQEQVFRWIYGNDSFRFFFLNGDGVHETQSATSEGASEMVDGHPQSVGFGGVAEGMIRCMMAIAKSCQHLGRRHYTIAEDIARTHKTLRRINPKVFKRMVKTQARILHADEDKALKELAAMITNLDDRREALEMARSIARVDGAYTDSERITLEKIWNGLGLKTSKTSAS